MSAWLPDAGEDPTNAIVPYPLTPAGKEVLDGDEAKLFDNVGLKILKEYRSWLTSTGKSESTAAYDQYMKQTYGDRSPIMYSYSQWLIRNGVRNSYRQIAEDFIENVRERLREGKKIYKDSVDFVRDHGDKIDNEELDALLRIRPGVITNPEPLLRENPQPAVLPEGQSYWDWLPDEVVRHVIRPMLPKERSDARDPTKLEPTPGSDYRWLYQRVADAIEAADEDYQEYLREYHEEHGEDEYPEEGYLETNRVTTTDVWDWIRDHPDDFDENPAHEIIAMFDNGEFELGDEDAQHYWDRVDHHDIRWLIENGTEDDKYRLYRILDNMEEFPRNRGQNYYSWQSRWANAYHDLRDAIDESSDDESSSGDDSSDDESSSGDDSSDDEERAPVRLTEEEAFLEPQGVAEEPSADPDPVGSGRPAHLRIFDISRGGLVLGSMARKKMFNR